MNEQQINEFEKRCFIHETKTSALEKIFRGDYRLHSPYASGISLAHDERLKGQAEYIQKQKEESEYYDHYKNMEAEVLYKCIIVATPLPYDVVGHIMKFVVRTDSKKQPPDLNWWHSHQADILQANLEERDDVIRELEENGEDTVTNIMRVKHDWTNWHDENMVAAVANVRLH
jgi:hypothetical protein